MVLSCFFPAMVTQNMVVGLPKVLPLDRFWKDCVLRKHHQSPFISGNGWCVSKPLDLDHSDLCCINKSSLVGERYALTFIDDLSCFSWVNFLKNMSHVFEILKEFRALDKKQRGRHVKCLRYDNGGEYASQ